MAEEGNRAIERDARGVSFLGLPFVRQHGWPMDWVNVFLPSRPIAETLVRGSVVYLALFTLLRGLLKREAGTVGLADLLMIVLLADAAQNAMAGDYRSVGDGLILVSTIVFWNFALDWLGYRFPLVHRFVHPPPLPLIKDGRLQKRSLRRELITEDELLSELRLQGVNDFSEVKEAFMEGDGRISVVGQKTTSGGPPERHLG